MSDIPLSYAPVLLFYPLSLKREESSCQQGSRERIRQIIEARKEAEGHR